MNLKKRGSTFTVKILLAAVVCGTGSVWVRAAEVSDPRPYSPLISLKRVCVEAFAGPQEVAANARDTVLASLFALRRFSITENCAEAEATLKGSVSEKAESESRGEGEFTLSAVFAASEKLNSSRTRRDASVALRLVSRSGEVLWAGTYDSSGGKGKTAMTDAIERSLKTLIKEIDRAGRLSGKPVLP